VTSKANSTALETTGTFFLVTLMAYAINFIGALWVMLAFGVAHAEWAGVPPFGYWSTYLLLCGLYAVGGIFRSARAAASAKAAS
jgi:hypothetical protein